MIKLGVVGANGQVGAELCLLLAREPSLQLVPICRTLSGSAFLRQHGIAVRHGSVADPAAASRLLGDCDVVLNCALATGTPRDIRRDEDAIVAGVVAATPPAARLLHLSTMTVYGDPRPGRRIRWRNPYGRGKLLTERSALRAARRAGKPLHILRLGHVCGELQNISRAMRAEIARGAVALPSVDAVSNTVYTVTIADAVLAIVAGRVAPGIYDLMNSPQWRWREVYEHEARRAGRELRVLEVPVAAAPGWRARARRIVGALFSESARNVAAKLLAYAPPALNARGQATWNTVRARREIAALRGANAPAEHLSWVENGSRRIAALAATRELLARDPHGARLAPVGPAWPPDLPDAQPVVRVADAQTVASDLSSNAT